jgi:hypothetical protein
MNVALQKPSLQNPDGKLALPLAQDVVHPLILTDKPSLENQLFVVIAILHELLRRTYNSDIIELAISFAKDTCKDIPSDQFDSIVNTIIKHWKKTNKNDPISSLF